MKHKLILASSLFITHLLSNCMAPPAAQEGVDGGLSQDPNNPYAVPGMSNQGGYAPAEQVPYSAPSANAPYQPIPSVSANAPADIPSYSPPRTSSPVSSSGGGASHVVESGDTLWGLSRKYGVSVDSIRQANSLTSDTIVTGQRLTIPR